MTKLKKQNIEIFKRLDLFLKSRDIVCADSAVFAYEAERKRKGAFSMPRHIQGLVHSKLSNQRKWSGVEPKLGQVDELFFNYDVTLIKQHSPLYFINGIKHLKCGNRRIGSQMESLHYNISVLERMENSEGGIDNFYFSMSTEELVRMLAFPGKYKLKQIGEALAWEYLRNVGIDGIKPDVHILRIMGANRLGYSKKAEATNFEATMAAKEIAAQTGLSLLMIDALLWAFCSESRAGVCGKSPNCAVCPIPEHCERKM